ncbi:helix-turn-helix domain-containing protein [Streptomyces sp. NPDC048349]|uniref:helix-turn-helix domain-containing protein n=1 Tax=Streptomyces sp. NPDC048349 TaxID=3155486 RepID=UPI003442EAD2
MRIRACPAGTWEFAQRLPHPALRPGVLGYRGFRLALGRPRRRLEIPCAAVTLVLNLGGRPLRVRCAATGQTLVHTAAPLVSGMVSRPTLGEHDGHLHGIEVTLRPWAAFRLFGVDMHELGNTVGETSALTGTRYPDLCGVLAGTAGWQDRFRILDAALRLWIRDGPAPCPRTVWAWDRLERSGGTLPVHTLAAETSWSERQLERRFREQIGLPPRTAARVLRVRRVLGSLSAGMRPSEAATLAGFYDQAHLNRDFKAMTAHSPSRFLALRASARPGPAEVDRVSGEVTSAVLTA